MELPSHIPAVRIPCIAHVIQLSLKELLGQMDANPRNDREEIEWADQGSTAQHENRKIVDTLNKVQSSLYIFLLLSILMTYPRLGWIGCSLYQQEPPTPRELFWTSNKRTKANADTRCSDTLEFYLPYAPARASVATYL